MTPLGTVPDGPATQRPVAEGVTALVKQLRGIKQIIVAGAGANTDIAIAGIATTDVLIGVVEFKPATPALIDRTGTTTITSAGNIQCSIATTSSQLLVTYVDVA